MSSAVVFLAQRCFLFAVIMYDEVRRLFGVDYISFLGGFSLATKSQLYRVCPFEILDWLQNRVACPVSFLILFWLAQILKFFSGRCTKTGFVAAVWIEHVSFLGLLFKFLFFFLVRQWATESQQGKWPENLFQISRGPSILSCWLFRFFSLDVSC